MILFLFAGYATGADQPPVDQAAPPAITSVAPPPGFEGLTGLQTTLVEVEYGGRSIGATLATYGANSIELEDVASLVAAIPGLADRVSVIAELSGELDSNTDRVCANQDDADCGELDPPLAGVIFDEAAFRLEIFINSDLLELRSAGFAKYLPPAAPGFSATHAVSASFGGTVDAGHDYNFHVGNILALGARRLRLESGFWFRSRSGRG
jgi:Mat/Ecp fimbriae outer membrane usher protein